MTRDHLRTSSQPPTVNDRIVEVVVFTGGRGSAVLSERLLAHPRVHLTLAVNGYDDGASTGEVRRFLGDALGPSDFRKNASRVARAKRSCSAALIDLLDARIPISPDTSVDCVLDRLSAGAIPDELPVAERSLVSSEADTVATRMSRFVQAWKTSGRSFKFADCAVGNLLFAGSFLGCNRRFNDAIDDYCGVLGLPAGVIDNVTDGTNAYLVALDVEGHVLGTEESIVDSRRTNRIADIFLIDQPMADSLAASLTTKGPDEARAFFRAHEVEPPLNPRLAARLDTADLIVYAPGTQHSSLFPSYLTPGLCDRLAGNLRATKLLVTNLQYDAEIAGASAVSLVERAHYYLTRKGQRELPAPCLITHYLLNDPQQREDAAPYVPLGQVDTFEDPRLVRIGYYEDGVSGRHDAAKVIEPFVESLLAPASHPRVGVLLYGTQSVNKLTQTLLEMERGHAAAESCDMHVYLPIAGGLDAAFVQRLPFSVSMSGSETAAAETLLRDVPSARYSYVGLFESSGMYRGEDLVALMRYVERERLDAVWGSRRLSMRDIDRSFRLYDNRSALLRAISRAGSHLLSVSYLLLYGRYVADTLSGSRVVRASDVQAIPVPLTHRLINQHLLSRLLRRRADLLEVPVQFLSLSPERVKRTGVLEGLRNLATIVSLRAR
jgi:2-phospho-L-lactate transferase/gluconeogenesis factor (CofD/UPF0052 family)